MDENERSRRLEVELDAVREENRLLQLECTELRKQLERYPGGVMQMRQVEREKAREDARHHAETHGQDYAG